MVWLQLRSFKLSAEYQNKKLHVYKLINIWLRDKIIQVEKGIASSPILPRITEGKIK